MNLREQLFFKYASEGIEQILTELIKKHTPKKGRRFNVDGLTYEISTPFFEEGRGIKFEISSKIPEEKFTGKTTLKTYFTAIKKIIQKSKEKFESMEMENIVHGTNKIEEKSRDYVKICYVYSFDSLYDEKNIKKQIASITGDKAALKKIPHIPGISTLGGKLVLLAIKDCLYSKCNSNIEDLINANSKVKKELKIK